MVLVDFLLAFLHERIVLLVFLWDRFANCALLISFFPVLFLLCESWIPGRQSRESTRLVLIGYCFAHLLWPLDCAVDIYNTSLIVLAASLGIALVCSFKENVGGCDA